MLEAPWCYTCERLGYGGCGHRHKTVEAAERCLARAARRYRRIPGGNSFCPWRVVAVEPDGRHAPVAWWGER